MFKGTATFELQNVKTGEVERIVDHNMFTNALNEVYNKAPFCLADELLGINESAGDNSFNRFNRLFETALGGILLFPQTLEEEASNIFAPASNKPVGIASMEANPAVDPRRGTYNAIESGVITNGYRYVYDFATSQGNGVIAAVSLTSRWGGASYLDNLSDLMCGSARQGSSSLFPYGRSKLIKEESNQQIKLICADETGMYWLQSNNKTVQKANFKPYAMSLVEDYTASHILGEFDNTGYVFADTNNICVMRTSGNTSGNATITVDRYSKIDFSKSTTTYTIPAPLAATKNGHIIAYDRVNDYLYCLGRVETKYFKTKLSNTADTSEIIVPSSGSQLFNCYPFFIGGNFLIETDNTVHTSPVTVKYPFVSRVGCYVLGGAESIASTSTQARSTSFNVLSPYLATINNLSKSVVKSPDKTMKVTYDVTYSS